MPKIAKIENSKVKNKRFRITLQDGSHYDFGLDTGKTYIDGVSEKTREAYRTRHLGNLTEKKLISSLIPSPSLFSYYILWGESRSIDENIKKLNRML